VGKVVVEYGLLRGGEVGIGSRAAVGAVGPVRAPVRAVGAFVVIT
jgi:hypothetical protein